jgi:hypothetical protein
VMEPDGVEEVPRGAVRCWQLGVALGLDKAEFRMLMGRKMPREWYVWRSKCFGKQQEESAARINNCVAERETERTKTIVR